MAGGAARNTSTGDGDGAEVGLEKKDLGISNQDVHMIDDGQTSGRAARSSRMRSAVRITDP